MCRRNQLCGFVMLSFGAGLLLSRLLRSGFLAVLLGLAAMAAGCILLGKR